MLACEVRIVPLVSVWTDPVYSSSGDSFLLLVHVDGLRPPSCCMCLADPILVEPDNNANDVKDGARSEVGMRAPVLFSVEFKNGHTLFSNEVEIQF